jgi:hypothetical protein
MKRSRARVLTALMLTLAMSTAAPADAWGALGHRLVSRVAIEKLPPSVPDFVRDAAAVAEISALGPEADRLKGSGVSWDADADHGHFIDLGDDAMVAGAVSVDALPPTREAFDTLLRGVGTDQYKIGYLPYEIIDGYEQVVTDFAYWRVDRVGERSAATDADKHYFHAERLLRETLTLRDIGYWSHFVGDASQPLHISVHYNGWGDYPNPNGYSNSHTIHARFETTLVNAAATDAHVMAAVGAYVPSSLPIEARVAAYLRASLRVVPQVYALEAAGGIDAASPAATTLVIDRLAAGATMLRDLTADAWTASEQKKIGYPPIAVSDVESGRSVLTQAELGGGN